MSIPNSLTIPSPILPPGDAKSRQAYYQKEEIKKNYRPVSLMNIDANTSVLSYVCVCVCVCVFPPPKEVNSLKEMKIKFS